MKVLVADDNHANLLITHIILERAGHHVVTVTNGLHALNQTKLAAYDLIILDIKMPIMDGTNALRRIRAETSKNKDTLIFALSAYCAPKDRQHYLSIGFDAVLPKPLRIGDLEKAIHPFWEGHRLPLLKPHKTADLKHIRLLDEDVIQHLSNQHSPEALLDIQSRHWVSIRVHSDRIRECLPTALEGDKFSLTEFRRSIHAIKAASTSIGLARVAQICRQVRNAPRAEISGLMQEFVEVLSESHSAVAYALSGTRKFNPAIQMRRENETEAPHDGKDNRSAIRN